MALIKFIIFQLTKCMTVQKYANQVSIMHHPYLKQNRKGLEELIDGWAI